MEEKNFNALDIMNTFNILCELENLSPTSLTQIPYEDFSSFNDLIMQYSEKYAHKLSSIFSKIPFSDISNNSFSDCIKQWIYLSKNICLIQIAVSILKEEYLDFETAKYWVSLYENASLDSSIKALGIYGVADTQKELNPLFCFEKQTYAFSIYPSLAEILGHQYIYEPEKIKDTLYKNCPVCDHNNSIPYYCVPQYISVGKNNVFAPVKLWKKCSHCHTIFSYNFPISEMPNINGHYTRNSSYKIIEPRNNLRIYSDIFNKCKQFTTGKKYLEIGIGRGEMLAAALEMGYEIDAVEICKEDCEKVSSVLDINIKWCDFLDFNTDKKYDIIIMGDVLEHISNPISALKKAKSLLNKEGILWLSTPNYNSGFTRLMGFSDAMWNQKNHFTYFSYESLLPFLEAENLNVVHYDISNRYNGSMELYCKNMD